MSKKVLVIGGNGYIGSRVRQDLDSKYDMHSVDVCWFGKNLKNSEERDFRDLTAQELSKYDVVILLAGHSSVKMCDGELASSWINNVSNFVELVNKLDKSQVLIYASSGSVYGARTDVTREDVPLKFRPINHYDLTKYTLDVHAENYIKQGYKIVGFRFGTVNGWSPNIREELMINSMTRRSIEVGAMTINNKEIRRPILGISDIVRAIDAVISKPEPGIYNLASLSASVEDISNSVSRILTADIVENPSITGVYDFTMSTDKFKNTYNFDFLATVDNIVQELVDNIDNTTFSNRNQFKNYE
jgi:UDP-glucose 4-epimerase